MPKTRVSTQDVKDASLTDTDIAAANKDGAKNVASMRTLSAATPAAIAYGGAGATGTAVTASSSDHVHPISAPTATQVSKDDATSTAADYAARIKLATDTTYRAVLGLDSSDRGVAEFGPGGTAATDLRLRRTAAGRLGISDPAGVAPGSLDLMGPAGSSSYFSLYRIGDSQYRGLWADSYAAFGPGATGQDTRLARSGTKTLTVDDATAGAVTFNVIGSIQQNGYPILRPRYRSAVLMTEPVAYWRLGEAACVGPSVLTGGTASASTDRGGTTYAASKAVDGDAGTRWATTDYAVPGWWQYDLGSGVTKQVSRVGFYLASTERTYNFTTQGSNDGTSWTTLYTGVGADNTSWQYFEFANSTGYRYWRIAISTVYAGVVCSITEIAMYERFGAADASGNGFTGSYWGAPTLGVAGALTGDSDTAVTLGTNMEVSVATSPALHPGDTFTLAAWYKRSASGNLDSVIYAGTTDYFLWFYTDDHLRLSKGGSHSWTSTATYTDTAWHFLVMTKNGADQHAYRDGAEIAGSTTNQTFVATTTAVELGGVALAGYYSACTLDEPAIWDRALTAGEVAALYAIGKAL